ncbi:hypothetical protein ACQ4PT_063183 [Festuca glaucescens]
MAAASLRKGNARLPPEVNPCDLFVRNLPFNISSEEMYDIFGKYGANPADPAGQRQGHRAAPPTSSTRTSTTPRTQSTTSRASTSPTRYLIVLYSQPNKMARRWTSRRRRRRSPSSRRSTASAPSRPREHSACVT